MAIGIGFAPFSDEEERRRRRDENDGGNDVVQEAIKILSLRLPTFSESAILPRELTQGVGGPISPVGPQPGAPPIPGAPGAPSGPGGHPSVPAPGTSLPPPSSSPPPPVFTPEEPPADDGDIDPATGLVRRGRRGGLPPGRMALFGGGHFGA